MTATAGILQDIRYAVRGWGRSPVFTVAALATLAIGIGANAAVFTVTNAVLFKGFPLVKQNDRILYLRENRGGCCMPYADFEDWRGQAKSFVGMAAIRGVYKTLSGDGLAPKSYLATTVSANTFGLLGVKPMLGRDFAPADEEPGAAPVAILRYSFWKRHFGMDPAVIGRTIRLNDVPTTVIGVMPKGFSFFQNQPLWLPLVKTPAVMRRGYSYVYLVLGRLAKGATIQEARAEMGTIAKRLARTYPRTNRGVMPFVHDYKQTFVGRSSTTYEALWGAVAFVLLIACANVANLLLGKAIGRSREISMRTALGASRWRIVRQLLVESVLLSSIGGVLGWWLAKAGLDLFASVGGEASYNAIVFGYTMGGRVLAYLVAVSTLAGVLFGLAPAFRLSRLDVGTLLKDGGHGGVGGRLSVHLSALLITVEMALAVVLLSGAGVTIRSFLNVDKANVGINTANLLTVAALGMTGLPHDRYPTANSQIAFYGQLKAKLGTLPGVDSVAVASSLPVGFTRHVRYEVAGMQEVKTRRRPEIGDLIVSPGYFRTVGAALLAGRGFTDSDNASGEPVVIVNERFAHKYWPGQRPLGKRLRLFDGTHPGAWRTVVGVASNIVQNDPTRQRFDPLIYIPFRQKPTSFIRILARTDVPPATLAAAFRRQVHSMDATLPVLGLMSMDGLLHRRSASKGGVATLFVAFAAIALLLAAGGLYAVVASAVSRRTQEIGIRTALGASSGDVRSLVFRGGLLPAAFGLGIGLVASLAVNRLLDAELVRVSPGDPATLVAASVILILAAGLGCLIPALRAARVDPVVALRHE